PRSEAYFVFPLAQGTPGKQCGLAATGDYQPSLRSPWLAAIDANNLNPFVPPERVVEAYTIPHPSGNLGRFVGEFDVSDDGSVIVFFVDGNVEADGSLISRYDRDLFVKTVAGIDNLTHDDQNAKTGVRISGDGSTIIYRGNNDHKDAWMITTPDAGVNAAQRIDETHHSVARDR
ncbi:hypothetical protein, partial [Thiolapillus sp.]